MKLGYKKSIVILLVVLSTLFLVSCNTTEYSGDLNIVEATLVAENYLELNNVIIIDARGTEAYDKGHLKNAVSLSTSDLTVDKPIPASIAPKAKIERKLSELGIKNDSIIYVYDDNGGVSAGRIWWTLKVYGHENVQIVNGGATALVKLGLEMSTDVLELPKSEYVAKEANSDMIVDYETLKAITEDEETAVKIIDVRSQAEYDAGSIPGSILYPHSNNLYKDGTFMSARDTLLFYTDKGFKVDDDIILYCKSSFRATQTYALLEEAGFENVKIYDGAWLEWELMGGAVNSGQDKAPITVQDGS